MWHSISITLYFSSWLFLKTGRAAGKLPPSPPSPPHPLTVLIYWSFILFIMYSISYIVFGCVRFAGGEWRRHQTCSTDAGVQRDVFPTSAWHGQPETSRCRASYRGSHRRQEEKVPGCRPWLHPWRHTRMHSRHMHLASGALSDLPSDQSEHFMLLVRKRDGCLGVSLWGRRQRAMKI